MAFNVILLYRPPRIIYFHLNRNGTDDFTSTIFRYVFTVFSKLYLLSIIYSNFNAFMYQQNNLFFNFTINKRIRFIITIDRLTTFNLFLKLQ